MLVALISTLVSGCVAYRAPDYYDSRDHGRWNGDRGYRGHEEYRWDNGRRWDNDRWDNDHHRDHDRY